MMMLTAVLAVAKAKAIEMTPSHPWLQQPHRWVAQSKFCLGHNEQRVPQSKDDRYPSQMRHFGQRIASTQLAPWRGCLRVL